MFESFIGVNPWTAFFVLLNTLALFYVLKILLFKPVKQMIDDRQKEIDDLYADNINFQRVAELRIELYTDFKDFDREATIESTLAANGWAYDKTDTYLDGEMLYVVAYTGDIIIEEEESNNG